MRSFNLVRWRLSRAFTPRASVQSKRFCIAPWTMHGLHSESCACASGSRKRPHLSSVLASCTFGGYGLHLNEHETGLSYILKSDCYKVSIASTGPRTNRLKRLLLFALLFASPWRRSGTGQLPLLDRLVGRWLLQGLIEGKPTIQYYR